ncbi:hypothetical protein GCM10007049_08050 [Echinicola pacifica]|uniref:SPOR domain-containing protein n=3 Tax=Echinicola pacifica TaxID=346377 RepID=A0A918UKF4_9BACT|nr:hypothetical protein GCM10007049_08050 [Echinicola pacifica]
MRPMKSSGVFLALVVGLLSACAGSSKISKSAAAYKNYDEDLTSYRASYPELPSEEQLDPSKLEGPVSQDAGEAIDQDLQMAMNRVAQENKDRGVYNGFTIMVYSGLDRDKAFSARNKLYNSLPEQVKVEMEYEQPRYLVKVGKYLNKIEAQPLYNTIKQEFSTARIIQQRFGDKPQEVLEPEAQ